MRLKEKWQKLIEAARSADKLRSEILSFGINNVVALIRENLDKPGPERDSAFRLARSLPIEQRQELLPDFVGLACEPSYIATIMQARDVILTLPKDGR